MSIIYERFITRLRETGYDQLSEYINTSTKVTIRCDKDHVFDVTPKNFGNGHLCRKCMCKCPDDARDRFIKRLNSEGFTLMSDYNSNKSKVDIRCTNGHMFKMTPSKFNRGQRCSICSGNNKEQAEKEFIDILNNEGYTLLGEYINSKKKVLVRCPESHEYEVNSNNFKSKFSRCPHCEGSSGQRELQKTLESYDFGRVICNHPLYTPNGLELDIYYPDISVAIEYCGNYWHNLSVTTKRDTRKSKLCKEMDIYLIKVWEDDYRKDKDKVVDMIINVLQERLKC